MIILITVVSAVILNYYKRSNFFRYPAKPETKLLPENVSDATQGFSFSQSEHGRTTFVFHAKSRLGFKDNMNLLESVTVKVFGKDGDRYDTITSNQCEYDQAREEIVFLDNVVITFGPISKMATPSGRTIPNALLTVVKVRRIKYAQKTGIAETEDEVDFARGRIHGKSCGLTYDSKLGSIYLHSQVEIFVDPAGPEDSEIHLKSDSLTYFKASNRIEMRSNVLVEKSCNQIRANVIEAFLSDVDSTLTRIDARKDVHSVSRDPKFMLQVDAESVSYFFGKTGRWLSKVIAQGNVQSRSLDPELKRDISANRVELSLRRNSNLVDKLVASGNVVAILADKKPAKTGPLRGPNRDVEPGDKIVKSPLMLVSFEPEERKVSRIEAKGPSSVEELPVYPKDDRKVLSALEMTLFFEKGSNNLEKFTANKQVHVEVIPPTGPVKKTTSDHLIALFDQQNRQISQLHQFGNFTYQEEGRQATAHEGQYFAQNKLVALHGSPQTRDVNSKTTADIIEFDQLQNLFKARGTVRSVFYNRDQQTHAGMFQPGSPVFASSDFMEAQTSSGIAKYWKKAKLWQEDQVISAETIYLYRSEKKLVAEKNVRSFFYIEDQKTSAKKMERKPVTIQAERMVYEDRLQRVLYERNVQLNSWMGVLNSRQLEVFLESEENQTSIERILAKGGVKIYQPGRTSCSESAEYFRSEEKIVLVGGPPRVVDPERGSTVGARLTLGLNDGSISVEGNSETRPITRQRVAR